MTEQEYTTEDEQLYRPVYAAVENVIVDDFGVLNVGLSDEVTEAVLTVVIGWLAEHDRQVQAEALEQAADAVRAFGGLGSEASGHTSTYSVRNWLRARAQAIREARNER